MTKKFAARKSKRERQKTDLSELLGRDVFTKSDEKLLEGALIEKIKLKEINVKEQVRTKFNDDSLKELAANIKANGLIQPLVVHRNKTGKLTLICGERRFRAMTRINKMTEAPCFIIENKTEEELMAIQFSENSSREELHYIDKADGILNYQNATGASERKICQALGISKSEVHRSLLIAKLPRMLKEAAKAHNTEKYVLLEVDALPKNALRKKLETMVAKGDIKKRSELKRTLEGKPSRATKKVTTKRNAGKTLPKGMTAAAFVKAMQANSKDLDKKTRDALKQLIDNTKDIL